MSSSEGGQTTGTADKDYNLIWFTEQCLSNALRLETYAQDADRDGSLLSASDMVEQRLRAVHRPHRARAHREELPDLDPPARVLRRHARPHRLVREDLHARQ